MLFLHYSLSYNVEVTTYSISLSLEFIHTLIQKLAVLTEQSENIMMYTQKWYVP